MTIELQIGDLVENPRKPEWGPGKVLEVSGTKVTVYFRDVDSKPRRTIETELVELVPASVDSDPFLDNLPPYVTDTRKGIQKRVTLANGLDKFRHYFPALFNDPAYLAEGRAGERGYKVKARELFMSLLGEGKGRSILDNGDIKELRVRLLKVEAALNLLSPYEKMALTEALHDEIAAQGYFEALFAVIEAPDVDQMRYEALIQAVNALPHEEGKARVATWPVLTQFPYIARPDCHMLLKPEVTQSCARRMLFDLNYQSSLNWMTYKQLLVMSNAMMDFLGPLGARDFIDVQSFIWAIGYYE